MSHNHPLATCDLISCRTRCSNHSKGSHDKEDKYDSAERCKQQGTSTQITKVKICNAENRPCCRDGNPNQDICNRIQNCVGKGSSNSRQSIGIRRSLSRQYAHRNFISTRPQHSLQCTSGNTHCELERKIGDGGHPCNKILSKNRKRLRSSALILLQSTVDCHQNIKGESSGLRNPLCDRVGEPTAVKCLSRSRSNNQKNWNSHQKTPKNAAHIQSKENMERPEDCWHCRDLNKEFNELRAQQGALEDLVRSMENQLEDKIHILEQRLEEQVKILHTKYKAEMELFLHRVHTLHEQYSALHNRCIHAEQKCIHAEEKIDALKKMLESRRSQFQSHVDPNYNLRSSV